MSKAFWKKTLFVALIIFLGFFFAQKIFFVTADLGRHIKNGEVFLERERPIATNYYSYTQPDFPTVNHHWGTGVVFYYIWKWLGFPGLSVMNIILYLSAFLFFFKIAENKSNFGYALFFSLLSIPLISSRTEIRPEGLSFFLVAIFYYLLCLFRENKISLKMLLPLIPLQVLWTNLHLFFIIGPFLIAIFWLDSLVNRKVRKTRQYAILGSSTLLACLINPYGFYGLLEPFMILREYGYMIVENQSIPFLQSRFPDNPLYYHFAATFLLVALSLLLIVLKKKTKKFIAPLMIMLFFSVLSWKAKRGIPLFGCFFIPILSDTSFAIVENYPAKLKRFIKYGVVIISIIVVLIISFSTRHYYSPFKRFTGIGLYPEVNRSAEFFKGNRIQGPIFNNYDIGGYLIFHLFPKNKVFVDNRPEAYSISFFKDIYGPMQEDEKKWYEIDKKFDFNCIYFYRHDITPHAQPFLIRRIEDRKWAPVFVDHYSIILLKRNKKNESLIKRYELPKSIFRVRK